MFFQLLARGSTQGRFAWHGWLSSMALALLCQWAVADQISITATEDTTIFSESSSLGNGAASYLFIGAITDGSKRRALLRFDLTAIPTGSFVTAAELRFNISRSGPTATNDLVRLHRVTVGWGEGTANAGNGGTGAPASANDATWTYRFFGNGVPTSQGGTAIPWGVAGGDFIASGSSAMFVQSVASYTFPSNTLMVSDVQRWLSDPSSNFGWIMIGPEQLPEAARRLNSRENLTLTSRPTLIVTYQSTPPGCICPSP